MNANVLIVDDDYNICELLRLYLEKEGFRVQSAASGSVALEKIGVAMPDIVLLDIMLPGMDGMQVCREIRKTSDVPIIMLTAKDDTIDKVLGLELGADDYVAKPFDPRELIARIKAVLRRYETKHSDVKSVNYNNLSINLTTYELILGGKKVETPPKELELIYFLASNPNKVFTREQLLDEIWGYEFFGDSRTVDVHIKRLREKLEGFEKGWELKTVWGVGYKFEVKSGE
ncbi:MAG: response regulator transcription factor [Clostridia bacterium]|nr:response regulator transcription factor [Clostridia bacterium]